MMSIDKLATALGLTPRQAYRRITLARPLLAPYIRRGRKGALLLDSSGLEILRRIEARREGGESTQAAILTITEEMRDNQGASRGVLEETNTGQVEILERLIDQLREENAFLRSQVERLIPLALPSPKRRWFAWLTRG